MVMLPALVYGSNRNGSGVHGASRPGRQHACSWSHDCIPSGGRRMKPGKVRPLAICVFRDGDHILAAQGFDEVKGQTFYRPLGGKIEFGERGAETVVREVMEEIGEVVMDVKYLGTLENIFTYAGDRDTRSYSCMTGVSKTSRCTGRWRSTAAMTTCRCSRHTGSRWHTSGTDMHHCTLMGCWSCSAGSPE